ncbi:MAG: PhnD/SsuA/transferrin family substrate-binding protein, partial [Candidatus Nealsonbacteria bacterium]
MQKILKLLFVAIIVILGIGVWQAVKNQSNGGDEIKVLRMGLIPADDAQEMLRDYEPIKEYLSEKLGMPVEIQVTSDYTAAIEAMRAKHIEMAWFGPFSYIIAKNVA